MPTINLQVAAGSDDAFEGATGTMNLAASSVGIISTLNQWAGVRFMGATVPRGATINSAALLVNINSTTNDTFDADFYGEAADNPGTFTSSSGNISGRARTTAKKTVVAADVGAGWYSIDVAAVVQELVNRSGWASGDAIVFILDALSNSIALQFRAYDGGAGDAAKLDIDYTVPSGGIVPLVMHHRFQLGMS